MQKIEMLVSGKTFSIHLFDSEPSRGLASLLPLQVEMQELNGNEKYVYLPEALPMAEIQPKYIHAGDLMLFGSKCLVFFYKDFSTSYRYTPLGRVTDIQQFAESLGGGEVSAAFQLISE